MPPFKMADGEEDDDEWSSFDSTPTDNFASKISQSTCCGNVEPSQAFSSSDLDFGSTISQRISRCFPLPPAASVNDSSCSYKGNRFLQSAHTIKTLSSFRAPLRWKDSRTEAVFVRSLRLSPVKGNKKPHKSQESADNAVLAGDEQLFSFHNLSRRATRQENQPQKDLRATQSLQKNTDSHVNKDDSVTANEQSQEIPSLNFDGHQAAVGLSHNSIDELILLREEMSAYVQEYSDTLVEELTHRDEQLREKTVKNKFISTLLAVQSRISLQQNKAKKSNFISEKYLTTVIPYRKEMGGLSTSILMSLIELMEAMLAESPTVPSLLTDYILKVLCAEDE